MTGPTLGNAAEGVGSSRSFIRIAIAVALAATAGFAAAAVLFSASAGSATKVKEGSFFGVLLGKNEIGADGKKRAGDLNGRGSASAVIDDGKLCYGLTVKDIDNPTGAHIHKANKGRNGGIVVPLKPPSDGDSGASSDCVEISDSLARAIAKNPHKYYWNIHTDKFPGGAVRGQLFRKTN